VAQQDLAAYIGITPVSLSRLKARVRQQAEATS
jgi:DNA-binding Xre family transcriptional regulator